MATTSSETDSKARAWNLRVWHGMTAGAWFWMLVDNRFAISPSRIPMAVILSLISLVNSVLALIQQILLGRRIARTRIHRAPIFIGHWRSGTTLMHELLALDQRYTYPDTYACLACVSFSLSSLS